ncbi:hypothetical protein BVRB_3g055290 [Beta vulgaris subsp. vulgaris]|nr:hypothetical protein BVRB_3g055290 [Beta vulgaris subsp. vulgaris]
MSLIHQLVYGFFFFLLCKLIKVCYLSPIQARRKLRKNGLGGGPTPSFPMGNLGEMKKMLKKKSSSPSSEVISHDINSFFFSTVFRSMAKDAWEIVRLSDGC